uniref:hypothetical protein n=1 Tax=Candidatus Limivicinus sp. TaxID=3030905 RepID=UPI003FF054A5
MTAELLLSALFQFDIYKDRVVVGASEVETERLHVCKLHIRREDEAVYDLVLSVLGFRRVLGLVEYASALRFEILLKRPALRHDIL